LLWLVVFFVFVVGWGWGGFLLGGGWVGVGGGWGGGGGHHEIPIREKRKRGESREERKPPRKESKIENQKIEKSEKEKNRRVNREASKARSRQRGGEKKDWLNEPITKSRFWEGRSSWEHKSKRGRERQFSKSTVAEQGKKEKENLGI